MRKYISYVIALTVTELCLALYLTFWREHFWQAVSTKDFSGFAEQLAVFTVIALVLCFASAFSSYFMALSSIKWREILNKRAHLMKHWESSENGNQRVQQDCYDYPELALNIMFGFGSAIAYILVFSVSLAYNFSFTYLTIIIIYAIVSTCIAKWIAKPLISLNYQSQVAEATYRNELTEFNFANCVHIMLGLAKKTKHLNYFQTFYGQVAVILPIAIVSPAYFGGAMTLGALMQATSTMSTISENCSYGIYSFNKINRLLSCRRRLKEIHII